MDIARRRFLRSLAAVPAALSAAAPGRAFAAGPQPARRTPMDTLVHVYKGRPPDHCVCDQALRQLPDGSWAILFMTGGDHEPRKANYVVLTRSTDRGATWASKETVLRFRDRACLLSEAYVHGDELRVMVTTHSGYFGNWLNFVLVSRDSGRSWDKPVPFEPMPRRAFIRNRYVSSWGEWFLPYQSYDAVSDPAASPLRDGSHKKALNGVLVSSDEGKTWTASSPTGPVAGWAENNVVELRDGRMVMLIRADGKGHLLRSASVDKGRTWSRPAPADIPNPGSKFRLHRLATGRIVLIHNPNPKPGHRHPLALWASDDDMETWAHKRVLVDFPGKLQYPDGFVDEKEGAVHFAFDYNRHDLIYVGARLPA